MSKIRLLYVTGPIEGDLDSLGESLDVELDVVSSVAQMFTKLENEPNAYKDIILVFKGMHDTNGMSTTEVFTKLQEIISLGKMRFLFVTEDDIFSKEYNLILQPMPQCQRSSINKLTRRTFSAILKQYLEHVSVSSFKEVTKVDPEKLRREFEDKKPKTQYDIDRLAKERKKADTEPKEKKTFSIFKPKSKPAAPAPAMTPEQATDLAEVISEPVTIAEPEPMTEVAVRPTINQEELDRAVEESFETYEAEEPVEMEEPIVTEEPVVKKQKTRKTFSADILKSKPKLPTFMETKHAPLMQREEIDLSKLKNRRVLFTQLTTSGATTTALTLAHKLKSQGVNVCYVEIAEKYNTSQCIIDDDFIEIEFLDNGLTQAINDFSKIHQCVSIFEGVHMVRDKVFTTQEFDEASISDFVFELSSSFDVCIFDIDINILMRNRSLVHIFTSKHLVMTNEENNTLRSGIKLQEINTVNKSLFNAIMEMSLVINKEQVVTSNTFLNYNKMIDLLIAINDEFYRFEFVKLVGQLPYSPQLGKGIFMNKDFQEGLNKLIGEL